MNSRSPAAFVLSVTLHALFAAAMFFAAYAMKDEVTKEGKTFELVAGEGDNYAATEAPALGTPDGPDVKMPDLAPLPAAPSPQPPAPEPIAPAPVVPESSPVEAVPPPPKETKKTPPKPEPSPIAKPDKKPDPVVPDLSRTIKRTQNRLAAKQKAQRDKEAKAAAAAAALAAKQAEYARLKAAQAGSGVKKIDAKGIAQGVLGGSTSNTKGGAGGTALSREEQDLLGTYIALLILRLREAHEKPTGLSDNLTATAEIFLAADGSIPRSKIVKSSGNAEFDASVLAAIHNVKSIGPRPDGKSSTFTVGFKMKDED